MQLKDIGRRLGDGDVPDRGSALPERLEAGSVPAELLARCGEVIFLLDENGRPAGKVSRELLEYLAERQTRTIAYKLLEQIEDGIIAVDEAGRIFFANQSYTRLLGVPLRRVIGRFIQDIEPGSLLCRALLEQTPQSSDKQLIESVGKYVSLRATPLWEGERFLGVVSLFQDVTVIHRLNKEVRKMTDMVDEYSHQLKNLSTIRSMGVLTQSKSYLNALQQAAIIARTDVPVLLFGENGVGKEVVANYIHQCSDRQDVPLVIVNCAAIPVDLLESELFGYEEGAFTGARKGGKKGMFEMANKGTLFLDEIGDMPLTMQAKLLRVLQSGELEKLGRQKTLRVDTRVIAATNQPLEQMIENKTFRKDLFFRLSSFTLRIPPLRERPEDVVLLTDYFLRFFNQKYGKSVHLSAQAYHWLMEQEWPGNVRQLQGCIERAVILEDMSLFGEQTGAAGLSRAPKPETPAALSGNLRELVAGYEAALIRQALQESGGNRSLAMEKLGLSRRTFYRKCAEHHLV